MTIVASDPDDRWVIRAGGLGVTVVATLVTAVVELYLTPLRVAGAPIGASVVFAVAVNWVLAWFALHTTRRRWAVSVPWGLWSVVMVFAAGARTPEGDHLLFRNDVPSVGDLIPLAMILLGSLSFAVFAYRMILGKTRAPTPRQPPGGGPGSSTGASLHRDPGRLPADPLTRDARVAAVRRRVAGRR
ncbi:hypothetical protein [Actinoplanes sp. NPDC089786]|uniref:hypothetical protein n=1 Tax=Actinoplanes sp. NPDC089786 TaxID=3155185 RepID=UPI003434E612